MVTILPPIYFLVIIFTFPPYINWNSYLICNRTQFLCNFYFLMWLMLLMPCPLLGLFYFQGFGLPLLVRGSWSGSLCRVPIALWELLASGMMLCRMAFHLSSKVVALHLDNSTAKAYLCNQGGTVSPFLSRLACQMAESDQQAWYYSYSSI